MIFDNLVVRTLVFPVPAPAKTINGPSIWETASFCLELRVAKRLSIIEPIILKFINFIYEFVRKIAIKVKTTVITMEPLIDKSINFFQVFL